MSANLNRAYETRTDQCGHAAGRRLHGDFAGAFAGAAVRDRCDLHDALAEPQSDRTLGHAGDLEIGRADGLHADPDRDDRPQFNGCDAGPAREQVQVISRPIGGGFGGKLVCEADAILAAHAARMLGEPVKVMMTRQQAYFLTCQPAERSEPHQAGDAAMACLLRRAWT